MKPAPSKAAPSPTSWSVSDATDQAVASLVAHVSDCEKQLAVAANQHGEACALVESLECEIKDKTTALNHAKEALRQAYALEAAAKKCG